MRVRGRKRGGEAFLEVKGCDKKGVKKGQILNNNVGGLNIGWDGYSKNHKRERNGVFEEYNRRENK